MTDLSESSVDLVALQRRIDTLNPAQRLSRMFELRNDCAGERAITAETGVEALALLYGISAEEAWKACLSAAAAGDLRIVFVNADACRGLAN